MASTASMVAADQQPTSLAAAQQQQQQEEAPVVAFSESTGGNSQQIHHGASVGASVGNGSSQNSISHAASSPSFLVVPQQPTTPETTLSSSSCSREEDVTIGNSDGQPILEAKLSTAFTSSSAPSNSNSNSIINSNSNSGSGNTLSVSPRLSNDEDSSSSKVSSTIQDDTISFVRRQAKSATGSIQVLDDEPIISATTKLEKTTSGDTTTTMIISQTTTKEQIAPKNGINPSNNPRCPPPPPVRSLSSGTNGCGSSVAKKAPSPPPASTTTTDDPKDHEDDNDTPPKVLVKNLSSKDTVLLRNSITGKLLFNEVLKTKQEKDASCRSYHTFIPYFLDEEGSMVQCFYDPWGRRIDFRRRIGISDCDTDEWVIPPDLLTTHKRCILQLTFVNPDGQQRKVEVRRTRTNYSTTLNPKESLTVYFVEIGEKFKFIFFEEEEEESSSGVPYYMGGVNKRKVFSSKTEIEFEAVAGGMFTIPVITPWAFHDGIDSRPTTDSRPIGTTTSGTNGCGSISGQQQSSSRSEGGGASVAKKAPSPPPASTTTTTTDHLDDDEKEEKEDHEDENNKKKRKLAATTTTEASSKEVSSALLAKDDIWLQNILPFVGPGHFIFVAGASRRLMELYKTYFASLSKKDLPRVWQLVKFRLNEVPITASTTLYTVVFSSLSRAKYWHSITNGTVHWLEVCRLVAISGNVQVVQWAHQEGFPWHEKACIAAVDNGHLACLQYARKNGCPWSAQTRDRAARELNYTEEEEKVAFRV